MHGLSVQDDWTEGCPMLVVGTRQVIEALRPREEGSSDPGKWGLQGQRCACSESILSPSRPHSVSGTPEWPPACFPGPLPEGRGCRNRWVWAKRDPVDSSVLMCVPGVSCLEGGDRPKREGDQAVGPGIWAAPPAPPHSGAELRV